MADPMTSPALAGDAVSDLPREVRVSASKAAEYLCEQYREGVRLRSQHIKLWRMVQYIMRGHHYFHSDRMGGLNILAPDPTGRKIRASAPLMKPKYRLELGRLNANQLGVSVLPKTGAGPDRFYLADHGQAVLDNWMNEVDLQKVFDLQNQFLCYFGFCGLLRYSDPLRHQVYVKATPGTQWFPIPSSATTPEEADGLMRVTWVSEAWLETQDNQVLRANNGTWPAGWRHMAEASRKRTDLPPDFMLPPGQLDNRGATRIEVWMKPSEANQGSGEWMLILNDLIYRRAVGFDPQGNSLALPSGTADRWGSIPVEIVYYTKIPGEFCGYGLCGELVSLQRERNRQLSQIIRNARFNKRIIGYDQDSVDPKDIGDEDNSLIPIRLGVDVQRTPLWDFPPPVVSRDVGMMLNLVDHYANQAVNHESNVLVGQQEGRTDSAQATERLFAAANAPLQTVIDNVFYAWSRTFPDVLDMLRKVWPAEKTVEATGPLNRGRELRIAQSQIPESRHVKILPSPMMPDGRFAMMQLMLRMKQLPSDDGQGFELKSREFRKGLRLLNFFPPGMSLGSRDEQRIADRIAMIIGDGNRPGIPPASLSSSPQQQYENHHLFIDMLRDIVLDPSFQFFGREVQAALMEELEFHKTMLNPPQPDAFNDEILQEDAQRAESYLLADELDLTSNRGDLAEVATPLDQ